MADLMNQIELTRLLGQIIPFPADVPIAVDSLVDRSAGAHRTIEFDTTWDNEISLPLTLRQHRGDITYWQTHDQQKINREWAVLRRLNLDGFPAPRPLARGEIDDGPFIIWVRSPASAWPADPVQLIAQAKPAVPQLASTLVHLHNLNHKGLNNEPLYQATVAGTLVRMLIWSREMESEALRSMIARLKPSVARLKSWSPALLHGNLSLENILARHGQIIALTGWENAAIGDPRWDVMTAAHGLRQIEPNLAEQLVNWYETFSGKTIADRPFWWAIISVRLWAIKAWTAYAIKANQAPASLQRWVGDLDSIKDRAVADLAAARL